MALYAMAITGRFGLGHGLLAWGRSVVWSHENNARLIAPNWLQLRIGPYLRRERDKRFYFKLFQAGQQIGGLKRLSLLLRAKRLDVEGFTSLNRQCSNSTSVIVEFRNAVGENEAKHFHEIFGRAALVHAALVDMTKPSYRPPPAKHHHIAVHIRGGDFGSAATSDQLTSGGHNLRLPIAWYVEMLNALRNAIGTEVPVVIYSDCSDAEISSVLTMPNCTRSANRESITDMLDMAQGTVLISSGSGFSRWGSYLGQVPRICYPGQRGVRVIGPTNSPIDFEPEALDGSDLPFQFVESVKQRFSPNQDTLNKVNG